MKEILTLKRTNSNNKGFISLVKELDTYLAIVDGDEHEFYDQYNKIDSIKYVVVAYENEKPVACGAIKLIEEKVMEVKRMFTLPETRGNGFASVVLKELENWVQYLLWLFQQVQIQLLRLCLCLKIRF